MTALLNHQGIYLPYTIQVIFSYKCKALTVKPHYQPKFNLHTRLDFEDNTFLHSLSTVLAFGAFIDTIIILALFYYVTVFVIKIVIGKIQQQVKLQFINLIKFSEKT